MQKRKNKFKLTPEAYKSLDTIAATLPKFQRKDKQGNPIWQTATQFKGTKDFVKGEGKTPTTYTKEIATGRKPLLVNHKVNLIEIWQKDGKKGVDAYVKFFMDLHEENKKAAEAEKSKKDEKLHG